MQTLEYKTIDKSDWMRGRWDYEPDKKQWLDAATELPCLIVRAGRLGHLCGYVGVSEGHPLFGKSDDEYVLRCHGGITFDSHCFDHSREQFDKWCARMESNREQAAKYPRGDAANDLKDHGHLVGDYDAWVEWCEAASVCHKVEAGENDKVWWLGFDCAHCDDLSPGMDRDHSRGIYRDLWYVENECRSLAKQLAEMAVTVG